MVINRKIEDSLARFWQAKTGWVGWTDAPTGWAGKQKGENKRQKVEVMLLVNRVRIDTDKRTFRSPNYWFRPSSVLEQEYNKWKQSIFKLHPNSTEEYSRVKMAKIFRCKKECILHRLILIIYIFMLTFSWTRWDSWCLTKDFMLY